MTILEDPAVAAKRERERNVRTVRNLNTVFGEVQHLGPEQQYYKSMVNEQMPLMTRYLREDTKRDESDWSDNSMAPGVALLGAAVARTGFGWHERDTGDKTFDMEHEKDSDKRYKAATDVFDQLLNKMDPQGKWSHGQGLLTRLMLPNSEASRSIFEPLRAELSSLYEKGVPHDDKGLMGYQNTLDSLIERTGDFLGRMVDIDAQLWVEGKNQQGESEKLQKDLLSTAFALKELQRMRTESVKHKYMNDTHLKFSPIQLKKIEVLERKRGF